MTPCPGNDPWGHERAKTISSNSRKPAAASEVFSDSHMSSKAKFWLIAAKGYEWSYNRSSQRKRNQVINFVVPSHCENRLNSPFWSPLQLLAGGRRARVWSPERGGRTIPRSDVFGEDQGRFKKEELLHK